MRSQLKRTLFIVCFYLWFIAVSLVAQSTTSTTVGTGNGKDSPQDKKTSQSNLEKITQILKQRLNDLKELNKRRTIKHRKENKLMDERTKKEIKIEAMKKLWRVNRNNLHPPLPVSLQKVSRGRINNRLASISLVRKTEIKSVRTSIYGSNNLPNQPLSVSLSQNTIGFSKITNSGSNLSSFLVNQSIPKSVKNESISHLKNTREVVIYKLNKSILELRKEMLSLHKIKLCDFNCGRDDKEICTSYNYNCYKARGMCKKFCLLLTELSAKLSEVNNSKFYEQSYSSEEVELLLKNVDDFITRVQEMVGNKTMASDKEKAERLCEIINNVATGGGWASGLSVEQRKKLYLELVTEFENIQRKLQSDKIVCRVRKFTVARISPTHYSVSSDIKRDAIAILYIIDKYLNFRDIQAVDLYNEIIVKKNPYNLYSQFTLNAYPELKSRDEIATRIESLPMETSENKGISEALEFNGCAEALLTENILDDLLKLSGIEIKNSKIINPGILESLVATKGGDSKVTISDNTTKLLKTFNDTKSSLLKMQSMLERMRAGTEKADKSKIKQVSHSILKHLESLKSITNKIINDKLTLYKLVVSKVREIVIENKKSCAKKEECKSCLLYLANLLRAYLRVFFSDNDLLEIELPLFDGDKDKLLEFTNLPKPHLQSFFERLRNDFGLVYQAILGEYIRYGFLTTEHLPQVCDYGDDCWLDLPDQDKIKYIWQASRGIISFLSYVQYVFNLFSCLEIDKGEGKKGKADNLYEFFKFLANRSENSTVSIGGELVECKTLSMKFTREDLSNPLNFTLVVGYFDITTGKLIKNGILWNSLICMNCLWFNDYPYTYGRILKADCYIPSFSLLFLYSILPSRLGGYNLPDSLEEAIKYVKKVTGEGEKPDDYGLNEGDLKGNAKDVVWNALVSDVEKFPNEEYFVSPYKYKYQLSEVIEKMQSFKFDNNLLKEIREKLREQLKALAEIKPGDENFEEKVRKAGWNPNYLFEYSPEDREKECKKYEKFLIK